MNPFSAQLRYLHHFISFSFNPVYVPGGRKLFVVATEGSHAIHSFEMRQDYFRRWQVVQPCPDWLLSFEAELQTVIAKEVSEA